MKNSKSLKMPAITVLIIAFCLSGCEKNENKNSHLVPAWTMTGVEKNENFGFKAAAVGSVNGDGYDDLLIGAPGYSNQRGRAFLYTGSSNGLGQKAAWMVEGENPGDKFGKVVGTLGDVNGDGYMDFFVAAPEYSTAKASHCGKVYVYLGGPQGPSRKPFWTVEGTTPHELLGDCAASAGDINGDGYPDFMIGAYGFNQFRGKAYLYLGGPKGFSKKPDWVFVGEDPGDWLGYGIGPAGDVNGDGYDDVMLGAKYHSRPIKNAGKVYLFYGSAKGLAAQPDWTRDGETMDSRFGHHLSGAGDVNGDGYPDVVIGAPGYDGVRERAYVFYGSPTGLMDKPDFVEGQVVGEAFGTDVGSAENVNGDDYAGVLVGGIGYALFPGSASLFLGSQKGLAKKPAYREIGEVGGDRYGWIVGSAGDMDGNGIPDWFTCAPAFGAGGISEIGKVYVYQGVNPDGISFRVSLHRKSNHSLVGPGGAVRWQKDSLLLGLATKEITDQVQLQAEVKAVGRAFDGSHLITSDWINSTGNLEVTGLEPGKAYRWRARLILKKDNKASHWVYPTFGRLTGSSNFKVLP